MMAQRFEKYLPTARGARPLSTLSQRALYQLWRADLIGDEFLNMFLSNRELPDDDVHELELTSCRVARDLVTE